MPQSKTKHPTKQQNPSITIVLELENGAALEADECLEFVRETSSRIAAYQDKSGIKSIQVALLHDKLLEPPFVRDVIGALRQNNNDLPVTSLTFADLSYYEIKMIPALALDSEILVYCDSDCTYSDNWPGAIIEPILNGQLDVACGRTFAEIGKTKMEKSCSLAWFFTTGDPNDPMNEVVKNRFYANNFALKSEVLRTTPFHRDSGSRTKGGKFIKNAQAAGFKIGWLDDVLGMHKQYETLSSLLGRAWMLGADNYVIAAYSTDKQKAKHKLIWKAPKRWFKQYKLFLNRMRKTKLVSISGDPLGFAHTLATGSLFHLTVLISQIWHTGTMRPMKVHSDYTNVMKNVAVSQSESA